MFVIRYTFFSFCMRLQHCRVVPDGNMHACRAFNVFDNLCQQMQLVCYWQFCWTHVSATTVKCWTNFQFCFSFSSFCLHSIFIWFGFFFKSVTNSTKLIFYSLSLEIANWFSFSSIWQWYFLHAIIVVNRWKRLPLKSITCSNHVSHIFDLF